MTVWWRNEVFRLRHTFLRETEEQAGYNALGVILTGMGSDGAWA